MKLIYLTKEVISFIEDKRDKRLCKVLWHTGLKVPSISEAPISESMLASWLFAAPALFLKLPPVQELPTQLLIPPYISATMPVLSLDSLCSLFLYYLSSSLAPLPPSILLQLLTWTGPVSWPRSFSFFLFLPWTFQMSLAVFFLVYKDLTLNQPLEQSIISLHRNLGISTYLLYTVKQRDRVIINS